MITLKPERIAELLEFLDKHRLKMNRLELLERAFTHSSYAFEHQLDYDNERMEFLGDAVLGLLVSDYLYNEYPRASEGVLAKNKSLIISRNVLGKRACDMGVGTLILLGKGEEIHGGRERATLLGSALEAIVGALYLDGGTAPMQRFIEDEIFLPARALSATDEFGDYKSLLQELVQKLSQTVPEYIIIGESGPDHSKNFDVEVRVSGMIRGHGSGSRKKIAENQAAMRAYWNLCEEHGIKLV